MTDEVKGVVEDTSEFKTSNDRQMYAVTVNGEDYSDFGHVPDDVDKGQPVRIEYSVSGQYYNIEEIEAISQDDLRAEAAGDADPRIAASQVVGQIYSENPPESAAEMAKIYRMTEHFAEYHMTGNFPEEVEATIDATTGEEVPDDVKEKIEKLSDRLGNIEQQDLDEVTDKFDVMEGRLDQLEELVQTYASDDEDDEEQSKAEKNAEAMAEDAPETDDDIDVEDLPEDDDGNKVLLGSEDDEEESDEEG